MTRMVWACAALVSLFLAGAANPSVAQTWSKEELVTLRSLWIGSLPALQKDLSNQWGDDGRAATLGQRFFFDTRFSGNGQVSCASCHQPDRAFTDGLPLGKGIGTAGRHTPTIIGVAYSPWFFWDGRKDSQWSQALGPMESPVEHGATRTQVAKIVSSDAVYRAAYEEIFGPLPDLADATRYPPGAAPIGIPEPQAEWDRMMTKDQQVVSRVYANVGKSIAAYERLIVPGASRFDQYVDAVLRDDERAAQSALADEEVAGLRLFIGNANCTQCHNGPLFTNNDFHNTSTSAPEGSAPDMGRALGITSALNDEFNCRRPFSDAAPGSCTELRFAKKEGPELVGSFKTPTLRNVGKTAPYMHDGRFVTLAAVLDHYNLAPATPLGHSELVPLGLSQRELSQLESFLTTLKSVPNVAPELLEPPE